MNGLPLHPAIVHIPLGLAVVIPLLAAGIGWAVWKGSLPKKAWLAVLVLQAIVVGAAVLALRTGEQEEERVEDRLGEARIEEHEERAVAFTWTAAAVLVIGTAAYSLRSGKLYGPLVAATSAGSVAVLALGLAVGHAGGDLVHGRSGLTGSTEARGSDAAEPAEARPAAGPIEDPRGRRHEDDDD